MWTKMLSMLFVGILFASCATAKKTGSTQPSIRPAGVLPREPNCGAPHLDMRIYNGLNTAINAYPWMVLLEYSDKPIMCVGSLINNRYVLTAAHCVTDTLTMVRLGEYDTSKRDVCILGVCRAVVEYVNIESYTVHPNYNATLVHNDIALLRLDSRVVFTAFIKPVCLPLANCYKKIKTDDKLTVSGWGLTSTGYVSEIKKASVVSVWDHDECVNKYFPIAPIIESQLCAAGKNQQDPCHGDSGGPLMRQASSSYFYLEGIVSHGQNCAHGGWPGVYTRVADFTDWIQANVLA